MMEEDEEDTESPPLATSDDFAWPDLEVEGGSVVIGVKGGGREERKLQREQRGICSSIFLCLRVREGIQPHVFGSSPASPPFVLSETALM